MAPSPLRLGIISAAGLSAPLWWTWSVSQLGYAVYLASGSPKRPTQFLIWASIYAPAFIVGLVTGTIVGLLSAAAPLKGWAVFLGSLVLSSIVLGVLFGELGEYLAALFSSPGNWFFFVGTALWPGVAQARKRRTAGE